MPSTSDERRVRVVTETESVRSSALSCISIRVSVVLPAPEGEDRIRIMPRRLAAIASNSHSTFCTCSRNCSICALSSSPCAVRLTSLALAQRVLASRASSWARKSSRRPIAPPSSISARAAATWVLSRSSSSRMSAFAASRIAS